MNVRSLNLLDTNILCSVILRREEIFSVKSGTINGLYLVIASFYNPIKMLTKLVGSSKITFLRLENFHSLILQMNVI